jgi:hypothetical protein
MICCMKIVCVCVDVCYLTESITCGLYGQDVSMYFVTPPTYFDLAFSATIQAVSGVSFEFSLFYPESQAHSGNVMLIHPENTCGIVVNNATVHDLGRCTCTIRTAGMRPFWSMTLNQTLQLCGR